MQFNKWFPSCLLIILLMLVMPVTAGLQAIASSSFTYSSSEQTAISPASESPIQLLDDMEWSSIATIFSEHDSNQQDSRQNNLIQVFDVEKGKVILSVPNNESFQKEAAKWLSDITSLAPEVQPDMNAKYIARVPLQPAQNVNVGNVQLKASVVFLFYYQDSSKEPLLLVFDENNKPFFFHIHEDVKPFFEQLNLPH